jgi:hypothetical protein
MPDKMQQSSAPRSDQACWEIAASRVLAALSESCKSIWRSVVRTGAPCPRDGPDPTSRNICGVPAVLCRRHPTDRSMSRGGADAHEAVSGAYGYRRPGDAGSAEEPGRDLPKMIAIIGFAVCGLLA